MEEEKKTVKSRAKRTTRATSVDSPAVGTPKKTSSRSRKLKDIDETETASGGRSVEDFDENASNASTTSSAKSCKVVLTRDKIDEDPRAVAHSTRGRRSSQLTEENIAAHTNPTTSRRSLRSGSVVSDATESTIQSRTRASSRLATAAPAQNTPQKTPGRRSSRLLSENEKAVESPAKTPGRRLRSNSVQSEDISPTTTTSGRRSSRLMDSQSGTPKSLKNPVSKIKESSTPRRASMRMNKSIIATEVINEEPDEDVPEPIEKKMEVVKEKETSKEKIKIKSAEVIMINSPEVEAAIQSRKSMSKDDVVSEVVPEAEKKVTEDMEMETETMPSSPKVKAAIPSRKSVSNDDVVSEVLPTAEKTVAEDIEMKSMPNSPELNVPSRKSMSNADIVPEDLPAVEKTADTMDTEMHSKPNSQEAETAIILRKSLSNTGIEPEVLVATTTLDLETSIHESADNIEAMDKSVIFEQTKKIATPKGTPKTKAKKLAEDSKTPQNGSPVSNKIEAIGTPKAKNHSLVEALKTPGKESPKVKTAPTDTNDVVDVVGTPKALAHKLADGSKTPRNGSPMAKADSNVLDGVQVIGTPKANANKLADGTKTPRNESPKVQTATIDSKDGTPKAKGNILVELSNTPRNESPKVKTTTIDAKDGTPKTKTSKLVEASKTPRNDSPKVKTAPIETNDGTPKAKANKSAEGSKTPRNESPMVKEDSIVVDDVENTPVETNDGTPKAKANKLAVGSKTPRNESPMAKESSIVMDDVEDTPVETIDGTPKAKANKLAIGSKTPRNESPMSKESSIVVESVEASVTPKAEAKKSVEASKTPRNDSPKVKAAPIETNDGTPKAKGNILVELSNTPRNESPKVKTTTIDAKDGTPKAKANKLKDGSKTPRNESPMFKADSSVVDGMEAIGTPKTKAKKLKEGPKTPKFPLLQEIITSVESAGNFDSPKESRKSNICSDLDSLDVTGIVNESILSSDGTPKYSRKAKAVENDLISMDVTGMVDENNLTPALNESKKSRKSRSFRETAPVETVDQSENSTDTTVENVWTAAANTADDTLEPMEVSEIMAEESFKEYPNKALKKLLPQTDMSTPKQKSSRVSNAFDSMNVSALVSTPRPTSTATPNSMNGSKTTPNDSRVESSTLNESKNESSAAKDSKQQSTILSVSNQPSPVMHSTALTRSTLEEPAVNKALEKIKSATPKTTPKSTPNKQITPKSDSNTPLKEQRTGSGKKLSQPCTPMQGTPGRKDSSFGGMSVSLNMEIEKLIEGLDKQSNKSLEQNSEEEEEKEEDEEKEEEASTSKTVTPKTSTAKENESVSDKQDVPNQSVNASTPALQAKNANRKSVQMNAETPKMDRSAVALMRIATPYPDDKSIHEAVMNASKHLQSNDKKKKFADERAKARGQLDKLRDSWSTLCKRTSVSNESPKPIDDSGVATGSKEAEEPPAKKAVVARNNWQKMVDSESEEEIVDESDDIGSESEEEESNGDSADESDNEFIDDAADCVDDYQSGDSMSEDERREIEENEIIVEGDEIGSSDTDEGESDGDDEYELDDFLVDDEVIEDGESQSEPESDSDSSEVDVQPAQKSKRKRIVVLETESESEDDVVESVELAGAEAVVVIDVNPTVEEIAVEGKTFKTTYLFTENEQPIAEEVESTVIDNKPEEAAEIIDDDKQEMTNESTEKENQATTAQKTVKEEIVVKSPVPSTSTAKSPKLQKQKQTTNITETEKTTIGVRKIVIKTRTSLPGVERLSSPPKKGSRASLNDLDSSKIPSFKKETKTEENDESEDSSSSDSASNAVASQAAPTEEENNNKKAGNKKGNSSKGRSKTVSIQEEEEAVGDEVSSTSESEEPIPVEIKPKTKSKRKFEEMQINDQPSAKIRKVLNIINSASGSFVEEPMTPEKKNKFGFKETPLTPMNHKFKVQKRLLVNEPGRSNKRKSIYINDDDENIDEMHVLLPRPRWQINTQFEQTQPSKRARTLDLGSNEVVLRPVLHPKQNTRGRKELEELRAYRTNQMNRAGIPRQSAYALLRERQKRQVRK